eukprot:gb/GEZN01023335.1/.p1 GENE.gb/GEZN01023335.1/~~gb/GEZN01023335.1/.p1  ORF type:complete len:141 (-),score=2.40 gb/GEZN01023335.1/:49-471(-)
MAGRGDAKIDNRDHTETIRGYEQQRKATCTFNGVKADWSRYTYGIIGHLCSLSLPPHGPEGEPWVTSKAHECLTKPLDTLIAKAAARRPRNNVPSNAQIRGQVMWLRQLCADHLRPTFRGAAVDLVSTVDPDDPLALLIA